jgi:hypothetical protein
MIKELIIGTLISVVLLALVYRHVGIEAIRKCYGLWFTKEYWTDYNRVEFLSWLAKAVIIVPGLIFGVTLWWLYFLTLFTSLTLIWASNKNYYPPW